MKSLHRRPLALVLALLLLLAATLGALSEETVGTAAPEPTSTAEPPVDMPFAGESPAQEVPAETPSAEEPSAEEAPTEESSAEEPTAEEAPAEEPSAEEPPVEEVPAEEPSAEETSDDDLPAEGFTVEVLTSLSANLLTAEEAGGIDYETDVDSDSAMFKVVSCKLMIQGGKMTAAVTLSGTGYDLLYVGKAEDAAKADAAEHIGYAIDSEGRLVFHMPVSKLDAPISIAAHSVSKDFWYDRALTFKSESMKAALDDGGYTADVESSSAMFKVVACALSVKSGKIVAAITLSGEGYDKLFVGTAEAAASADPEKYIGCTLDAEGRYTFLVPVAALDVPISIAAHSVSKDLWYDRALTFKSESLTPIGGEDDSGDGEAPGHDEDDDEDDDEGGQEVAPPKKDGSTKAVNNATGLADGVYTPDKFTFSGGTGRVSISCSTVTVREGKAYATIVFGSGSYAYVKASGSKYFGSHGSNTSTFEIPVLLNADNTIIGMTTAMSQDYEITYTLYIYLAAADADAGSADEDAPAIIGLKYQSTDALSHARQFAIYRYEGGYVALRVAGEDEAGAAEYLLIPADAKTPEGLNEGAIVIQLPVERAYVASEDARALLALIGLPDDAAQRAFVDGGAADAPDYAALLKAGCDLAILPSGADEAARLATLNHLERLGIPAFIDRSAEEETEEGRLEWLKLYGLLFGFEPLAEDYLAGMQ